MKEKIQKLEKQLRKIEDIANKSENYLEMEKASKQYKELSAKAQQEGMDTTFYDDKANQLIPLMWS